ncbi:hypothetical protein ACHHYP_05470 [Achlya hypogyna]|uniref:Uncharacterized protein n=1 Tax=Achlya hypogyna TaxID=1202772 RepID=A0A1V9YY79_ACHHY|nr:hypothetical protein ACHHYP_05470 [Achlya hypogyna]
MSASPRTKSHALRAAAPLAKDLGDPALQHLLRPVLHNKHKLPQRPPKPAPDVVVTLPDLALTKPASRGEDDDQRGLTAASANAKLSNQPRPRSMGPEAGDVAESVQAEDSPRPILASDVYFELQRQEDLRMSPRVARQHNRHLYHDKMQAKYSEMRVLRARIKALEADLETAKGQDASQTSDEGGRAPAPSPEKPVDSHAVARDRMLKLERHLLEAKEEIQGMRTKLDSGRTNDKALIDTLVAKLELERSANKVLGQQIFELDAALKVATQKLTAVELELEGERLDRDVMIEQLTSMSRQAISDHRRKIINTKVKTFVSAMGKESLQSKLDATLAKLRTAEATMQQMELEVATWKREAQQKQAALDDWAKRGTSPFSYSFSSDVDARHVHPVIPALLERAVGSPDVVFQGTRLVDGHSLFFHVVRGLHTDSFALHFVAYEPTTAQEDVVTFYSPDVTRLVHEGDKYLLQASDMPLTLELVELLFATLAVGFKNGTFVLVERGTAEAERRAPPVTTTPIFRGSMLLRQADVQATPLPVALVINEVSGTAFSDVWSLDVHAAAVDDEREWRCVVGMEHVCYVCPGLASYRPRDGNAWRLHHRMDANAVVLAPLLKTFVLLPTPAGDYELTSTLLVMAGKESTGTAPGATPEAPQPLAPPRPTSPADDRPILHRTLKTIGGAVYYVTLRELWDAGVILEASLYDTHTDALVQQTFEAHKLMVIAHCAVALHPGRPIALNAGIPARLRSVLAPLLVHALELGTDGTLALTPQLIPRHLSFEKALPTHRIVVPMPPQLNDYNRCVVGLPPGRDVDVEVLDGQRGSVLEDALPRLFLLLRRHRRPTAARLRGGSVALVHVLDPTDELSTTEQAFFYVVKAVDVCCRVSWLVVQRDLPLEFVLQLWRPTSRS